MNTANILIGIIALVVGGAVGYFFSFSISLGQKGSMELEIKQKMIEAKEDAQKILSEANEKAREKLKEVEEEEKKKAEKKKGEKTTPIAKTTTKKAPTPKDERKNFNKSKFLSLSSICI